MPADACTLRKDLAHSQYTRLPPVPQAKVLGHSLHHHKDVTTAFLTGTRLSERGVRHLAHAIAGVRRRQRSLALPSHRAPWLIPFAPHTTYRANAQNTRLEDLHLGYNHINDHGVHHLAKALKRNMALKRLHLEGNDITDVGALELLDALHHNLAVSELYIRSNQISAPVTNALVTLVAEGAKRAPWGHKRKRQKKNQGKNVDSKVGVKKAPPTRAVGQPKADGAKLHDAEL